MSSHFKRCTFAIISHPDAGKTTMTEKLLWFGRVIREMGMVKSKSGKFAKSDWMEIEKERGISVTSSVMSFNYNNRALHLLDTPGHNDFSEDTFRVLTAVESALMMIDSAKGVETQTIKLMDVCRLRDTPIVTFMNKFDRDALGPFELLDNVEKILNIQCVPMTWPLGDGVNFKGVYDFKTKSILSYREANNPDSPEITDASDINSPLLDQKFTTSLMKQLRHDIEMAKELIPPFNQEEFLAGIQTPVFFGSALQNFGVKETLTLIAELCPPPGAREAKLPPYNSEAQTRIVLPSEEKFSGFIFKIQANMDKRHRDRVAFLRVCSGKFKRNEKIFHVRSEKELKISTPLIFLAQDREVAEEAFAGDIIGLYDTGKYQIGDTFTEGEKIQFTGIPSFAPEIFMKVILKDPLKGKQLEKGLQQLSEEGTVQIFSRSFGNDKILGAVGMLQFEVVKYRLADEYGVTADYQSYGHIGIRWLKFLNDKAKEQFLSNNASNIFTDNKNRLCFAVKSEWDLKLAIDKNPEVQFFKNSDYR